MNPPPEVLSDGTQNPLLILSIILLAGLGGGWIAGRLHVPRVTGNIVAGVLVGLLLPGREMISSLQPLSSFAMGLIAASVGSHLSYRRVHNALRRILAIALTEVFCAVVLVTFAVRLLGADWPTCILLGCISAATAPATTVALIRETRAKGSFVKTLLTVVALNNMLCIMFFAFASTLMKDFYASGGESTIGMGQALYHTARLLVGSLLLGVTLGAATEWLVHRPRVHDFSAMIIALLLCVGLSSELGLNFLLTSLFFGVYLGNASPVAVRQTESLAPIEMLLFICFFTLAGASLHLDTVAEAGWLCVAYLVARVVGKGVGAALGGYLSGASRRIWSNIGLALVPQAGVAIGLVVLLEGDPGIPAEKSALIATLVLGAVTINEIVGPFFTRHALRQAKEANKDRRRIIEFLQEEYIVVNLKAANKWEVLKKLTDFYVLTHHVPAEFRDKLYASIEERERECTTAVGVGVAIPHGRVDQGGGVRGVLGICPEGIEFGAFDEVPVKIIMLVVTPNGYEREHLEVMASLAQMMSDTAVRTRLIAAINANDAWEVLESEDTRSYNYFLESETPEADQTSPGSAH